MKVSLSHLLILIGVLFCIMLASAVLFMSRMFWQINQETDMQLRMEIMQSSAMRIEDTVEDVELTLRTFASRSTVLTFMQDNALEKFSKAEIMRNTMDDMTLYVPLVKSLYLIINYDQQMRSSYNEGNFLEEYLREEELLKPIMDAQPFYHTQISDVSFLNGVPCLALAVPMFNVQGRYLGLIAAICDLQELTKLLPDNMAALLLQNDRVLLGNHSTWKDADDPTLSTILLDGQTCSLIHQTIPSLGWDLVCAYPQEQYQTIAISSSQILVAAVLLAAVIFIILMIVHRMIVGPIESITWQMEEMSDLRRPIVNRHKERNELTRLTNGINEMTDRIEKLNQDILQVNREKYQLQLNQLSDRILLLQTQINPHFLYNNLECIRGMAYLGNMEGIREMAVCMAHVARYSAKGGLSTIGEEVECVKSYFRIISLRYDNVYDIRFNISKEVEQSLCPRMIVQPIVENSVLHGFVHAKRHSGTVCVSAEASQAGGIFLAVEDDGIGLKEVDITKMNAEFRAMERESKQALQERIGLYNVNYRLCLMAETSGLHMDAVSSGGLQVTVEFWMHQKATE